MTFEEFLVFGDEDTWAEWVDGKTFHMSPITKLHQGVLNLLFGIFLYFVDANDLGFVTVPTFAMKLANSAREPDILFISKERLHLCKETYMDGPADLVVEVVSPESRQRDQVQKLKEYEEGGVREYWLIDPFRKETRLFQLRESAYVEIQAEDGIYRSVAMPGLWIRLEWLWEPQPKLTTVLKELKLI